MLPIAPPLDEMEIRNWYEGKDFAYDWTSPNFSVWTQLLAPFAGQPIRILEIGSYEGRSALFFLNFLRRSSIVCIDVWDSAILEPALVAQMPEIVGEYPKAEARFDRNLSSFTDRLEKIKGPSTDALTELGLKQRRFELVYVDGEHRRPGAYRDCVLSWPLLTPGGLLIIDDYEFDAGLPPEAKPKEGIDAFLSGIFSHYDELHRAYQIAIRKH
jgi:predicted O-methyltransferase YrrM